MSRIAMLFALVALVFSGCEKKEEAPKKEETAKKTEKKVEKKVEKIEEKKAEAPPPAAAAAPKDDEGGDEAAAVMLKEVTDEGLGYAIKIPENSKELQKTDMAHTYSFPLPNGNEYNVHLTPMAAKDLADLKATATMMGQKEVVEEKELEGGGFQIVKKPQGIVQEVWVYKKGPSKHVTAKCTGPSDDSAKLVEICSSLSVTK